MIERISSTDNKKVKLIRALLGDRGERNAVGLFVAEGKKLCEELFASDYTVVSLWFDKANADFAQDISRDRDIELYEMSDPVAAKLTDQKTPQGVFAVAKLPECSVNDLFDKKRVVLLSSVADPHNVGAIIRSACAFGFDGVCVCGASADVYSPKTLRGSMGTVFMLTCVNAEDSSSALEQLRDNGFSLVAAALCDGAVPINELKVNPPLAVAIGNESRGLSEEEISLCTPSIIPISRAESLNASVAASIYMWELGDGR